MAGQPPITRDIVVVGGSAGALSALQTILRGLPGDFPAAILVVVHQAQSMPGRLPDVLGGPLPAQHAVDGEPIEVGRVYVAPADHHLLVQPSGHVRLSRGPKQNRFRPAIDPLFRTAARVYGPQVIGVVLSGLLDDGTRSG
jgi:two-component system, chemotaxis family, protein-glutamate methylesterase/glutaminase